MNNFSRAGRAEILRAAQKDDEFCDQLLVQVSDFVGDLAGQRLWLTRHHLIENITKLIYQSCTTLRNLQTLGEEYTGIVQVDSTGKSLPSKFRLASSIALDSGGALMVKACVQLCEKSLRQHTTKPETHEKMQQFLTAAKFVAPFLQQFHKTLFYLNGDYYHFAKRCMGINYVLFRSWLKDRESRQAFHWLGIVSALYLALTVLHSLRNNRLWTRDSNNATISQSPATLQCCPDPSMRCSLCLETRTDASCTPCGHLFCWACIHEWLTSKNECPLCREQVSPSRVIRLQNYHKSTITVANYV